MNNKRMRFLPAGVCALCALSAVAALEWPVTGSRPVRFFGQRSEGAIESGITVENAEMVRAAGHGRLLITMSERNNMSGFPGTLGNAAVIAHDDGILTVYGNLDSTQSLEGRSEILSQTVLGNGGASGWGSPGRFSFIVIDEERRNLLNPLLLITPPADARGPFIRNVALVPQGGQTIPLGGVKAVRQGTYRIYANVGDTIDGSPNELAPFRISVLVNGSECASIPFEVLQEQNGRLYLADPANTRDRLFSDSERMYLGELSLARGRADIAIIASDASGNERSVQFGLLVN